MSILKIEKLNTYYGKSHILQGVNFDLNKTGCLAVILEIFQWLLVLIFSY